MIKNIKFREVFFFGIVGIVATLTHYFTALGAHEHFGISLYVANFLGYGAALAVSYFGHGKFSFQTALSQQIFKRFCFVSVGTFLVSELLLLFLEGGLELSHRTSLLIIVLIIPAITFVLHKFWVYRGR